MHKLFVSLVIGAGLITGCNETAKPIGHNQFLITDDDGSVNSSDAKRTCGLNSTVLNINYSKTRGGDSDSTAAIVTCGAPRPAPQQIIQQPPRKTK